MLESLCRNVFFRFNPERIHNLIISNLDWVVTLGLLNRFIHTPREDPVTVMGLRFPNSIGLSAGMDRNGECVSAFGSFGFGHVEVGTVTPVAQPGNPRPRYFRLPSAEALINRFGFANDGCEHVLRNLKSADAFHLRGGILGVSIGKNTLTPIDNAVSDYRIALNKMYSRADYITLNISSPNTRDLFSLQARVPLKELLTEIDRERSRMIECGHPYKPIAVKLSGDLTEDELLESLDTIVACRMDGVILANATTDHTDVQGLRHCDEEGGLSGRPLMRKSTDLVYRAAGHLNGALPIIATGGVMSGEDAVEKMRAGASLVQIHTGLIYRGPTLAAEAVDAVAAWRKESLLFDTQ